MAPIDAEQHASQQQLVLEMIDQLRGALDGRLSRGEVGAWARSVWPENAGQGSPFLRHGSAATVFDGIYGMNDKGGLLDHELRAYLRWLVEGETFRADNIPFAVLPGRLTDWLRWPGLEAPVRFVIDGIGWHEGAQLACPATGRAFFMFKSLETIHGDNGVLVNKLAQDDLTESVLDLFETFAIDERDVLHIDAKFDVTSLPKWELWRLDDNANEMMIDTFRSRAKAVAIQQMYEARGHRQTYWVRKT